ncbi:MAG: hypothetical protein DRJ07_09325 [Bacteroidetes bacterium]|nr:MAG: hypothetical protein DRJ07_09325 [Bacteroidota bacterium]
MKLSLFFIGLFILTSNLNIVEVRKNYKDAVTSQSKVDSFNESLKNVTKNDDKRLVAYKGAAIALAARYLKGAKQKSETFKSGVELVEFAIDKKPLDLEVRFVRLSIQQNSPKFLGYNKEIEGDKNYILTNYNTIRSKEFKKYLGSYILESGFFTEVEKSRLN